MQIAPATNREAGPWPKLDPLAQALRVSWRRSWALAAARQGTRCSHWRLGLAQAQGRAARLTPTPRLAADWWRAQAVATQLLGFSQRWSSPHRCCWLVELQPPMPPPRQRVMQTVSHHSVETPGCSQHRRPQPHLPEPRPGWSAPCWWLRPPRFGLSSRPRLAVETGLLHLHGLRCSHRMRAKALAWPAAIAERRPTPMRCSATT